MHDRHPQLVALITIPGLQQVHIDDPDTIVEQQLGGSQDHRTPVLGANDATLDDFHKTLSPFHVQPYAGAPFQRPRAGRLFDGRA